MDIVGDAGAPNKVTIRGNTDLLEIHVDSLGQGDRFEFEINGEVGKIVLSGDFDGEVVLSGTGKVGSIETGEGLSDGQKVRLEGDLEVGTLNGRPVAQPTAPSSPGSGPSTPPAQPDPQPDPQPGPQPEPQPDYEPSVTEAVYDAFADYAEFGLETSDAAKVYYVALDATLTGPADAEALKDLAASKSGFAGTADVSGGKAAITVTGLDEEKDYVLYAAAEAPDGTLSEVYHYPFKTEPVNILVVNYTVQPLGDGRYQLHFVAELNAISATPVYWLLIDWYTHPYPEDVENGCGETERDQCGNGVTGPGTGTMEFEAEVPESGIYFLHVIAKGKELSPVYSRDIAVDTSPG